MNMNPAHLLNGLPSTVLNKEIHLLQDGLELNEKPKALRLVDIQ
jgi:hypothetical protein